MSGYVRIHRSLIGHPAFRNDAEAMAFAWMICQATWRRRIVRYRGHDITLERGDLTVSIRDFAERMDRSKGWAERLFARLREHGMIEQKSGTQVGTQVGTHGGTIGGTPANVVTICNYDDYQSESEGAETLNETPSKTGAGQTRDTEQIREEREEEKEEEATPPLRASPQLAREALSDWNRVAPDAGWPTARSLNKNRAKCLGARLRENGLDGWRAALLRARASPYLGRDPPTWFTFDWIIKDSNFLKLIEGNYDRNRSDQTKPISAWGAARDTVRVGA